MHADDDHVDDGLAADLKRRARAEGKSVSAVVAEALRAQLTRREVPSKAAPFRLITVKGGGLQPGVDVTRLRTIEETEDLERFGSAAGADPLDVDARCEHPGLRASRGHQGARRACRVAVGARRRP